jgi:hypothetical protein
MAIRIQEAASVRLDEIYRYTRDTWGEAQAETYITGCSPRSSATCPRESVLRIRLRRDFSVVFEGYAGGAEHWPRRQVARERSLRSDILRTS